MSLSCIYPQADLFACPCYLACHTATAARASAPAWSPLNYHLTQESRQSWIHSTNWRYTKRLEALLEISFCAHKISLRVKQKLLKHFLFLKSCLHTRRMQLLPWRAWKKHCKVQGISNSLEIPRAIVNRSSRSNSSLTGSYFHHCVPGWKFGWIVPFSLRCEKFVVSLYLLTLNVELLLASALASLEYSWIAGLFSFLKL